MRVVSDTSPVSNLAITGRLEFLLRLHREIVIPPAVEKELSYLRHPAGYLEVRKALVEGWLKVEQPEISLPDLPGLHLGELEAISLARQTPGSLLLVDESEGRACARSFGLAISGVIGVLIAAKNHGWIGSLKNELLVLRSEAKFFISPKLSVSVLAAVGEGTDRRVKVDTGFSTIKGTKSMKEIQKKGLLRSPS